MIPLNRPYKFRINTKELVNYSGDGYFTKKVSSFFESELNSKKVLMTTSCTSALEMIAILLNLRVGDEIIAPSYTFVSTVNAFVLRGARIRFVDIRPDTLNIDENKIENAITEKTKAIIVVHYAGVACEMDEILRITKKYNLVLVEDAAQAIFSKYKGKYLGTLGDFGAFSFHETKNFSMGEGGALIINNPGYIERAEIIREKGTDRSKFYRNQVDKYTWVDIGSSYLPSDILVGYLDYQLSHRKEIQRKREIIWNRYKLNLSSLRGIIEFANIPNNVTHNYHMFYIKCTNLEVRDGLISYLKNNGILAVFHYVPLHSSPAGKRYGAFNGEDEFTTAEFERLVRLPIFYDLTLDEVDYISDKVISFFNNEYITH
jgi:dTDP-4-amino-4,6-dideoxygalactose transaminase